MKDGVSIIIPTWNGGDVFRQCLKALSAQQYNGQKELIVIDSGSTDGTYEVALEATAIAKKIDQKNFHHSRTRNEAVSMAKYSRIVLLVQDAIPISDSWLNNLVKSIDEKDVVAAYGRQVPHDDADLYARFEVNYHSEYLGHEPMVQEIESLEKFRQLSFDQALRRVRFDNVCAIYKREFLLNTPFPDVPFAEDMAWALEVMKQGLKVLYQPNVKVYHSHNRNPEYRFRRAIIDTLVCSELLGKVSNDLSFYRAEDLYDASQQLEEVVKEIYLEVNEKHGQGKGSSLYRSLLSYIIKRPFIKKIFWSLIKIAKRGHLYKTLESGLKQSFGSHIRNVLALIVDKYPGARLEELHIVIDQIAASIRGQLYGEVYASYKIKGNVPSEIEELIQPHLRGV